MIDHSGASKSDSGRHAARSWLAAAPGPVARDNASSSIARAAGSPASARAHARTGELEIIVKDRTRPGTCTPSHCAIMPPSEAPAT